MGVRRAPPTTAGMAPGVIGLVVLAAAVAGAAPPQCDPALRPVGGGVGYLPRGNRCEGLYVAPISGRTLEIVSLTIGPLRYPLEADAELALRAPALPDGTPLRVRAVALPLHAYYRMDAVIAPGETLRWPVGEVLAPARLGAGRVGLYGWRDTDEGRVFVPLNAGQAQSAEAALLLVVRSAVDTAEVLWRARAGGGDAAPPEWQTAAARPLRSGQPIRITLPPGPAAILRVEVAARERASDEWTTLAFRLHRPALP